MFQNNRAWVIGKNIAGMPTGVIMRGVDLLVNRPDVDMAHVRAQAREVRGAWLLMDAATDPRIGETVLDRTLRAALEVPITHDLSDAVIPGFALHWDLSVLVKAIAPRSVVWTNPTDWRGIVVPHLEGFRHRRFSRSQPAFLEITDGVGGAPRPRNSVTKEVFSHPQEVESCVQFKGSSSPPW